MTISPGNPWRNSASMRPDSVRRAAAAVSSAYERVHGRAPSNNALVVLMAHSHLESTWGRARYRKYPLESKTYCEPLNNWGAVHGQGSAGSCFPAVDTMDGTPATQYKTHMAKYATPADGAEVFVKEATARRRTGSLAFADRGDVRGYAHFQHAHHYFTANPDTVARGYGERAEVIADRLNIPWPPAVDARARNVLIVPLTLAAGALAVVSWLATKR